MASALHSCCFQLPLLSFLPKQYIHPISMTGFVRNRGMPVGVTRSAGFGTDIRRLNEWNAAMDNATSSRTGEYHDVRREEHGVYSTRTGTSKVDSLRCLKRRSCFGDQGIGGRRTGARRVADRREHRVSLHDGVLQTWTGSRSEEPLLRHPRRQLGRHRRQNGLRKVLPAADSLQVSCLDTSSFSALRRLLCAG